MLGTAATPRRIRARTCLIALIAGLAVAAAPWTGYAAAGAPAETNATESLAPNADSEAEPFGRPTSEIGESPLIAKWEAAQRTIDAEMSLVALCRLDLTLCPSPAAVEFLTIVERARQREGLARLGEINRAINLGIRPATDLDLYEVEDFWSSPLLTLATGAGDCEDYAIAKFVALREAGVAPSDLRLVILRDSRSGADHAVAAVRAEQRWRILDSRRLVMLDDNQYIHFQGGAHFEPVFSLSVSEVRRYDDNAVVAATAAPPIF